MPEPLAEPELQCPTCRARQTQSDTCRRCKCDLTLVVQALRWRTALRRSCLQLLVRNRASEALPVARQLFALQPDDDARRLLAVCLLRDGRFDEAARFAAS